MKRMYRLVVGVSVALALVGCGADGGSTRSAQAGGNDGAGGGSAAADGATSDALAADLQFLREEEKLARDVYATLYERWHLRPHQNIASSEQTHTSRVKDVLVSLGVPDPVKDDAVGVFVNPDLRKLYGDLVARGLQSEVAALEVGATIEDLDIRDIERMKARTTNPAVLSMYESLECGSRNHLRAYTSQLAARGTTYAPQYIGAAELATIRAASNERCGR